ncbi:PAS domain S-box-containing protein [Quadrisphaera granulorum]|uniref:histidine kinase n=1 Tax=Quadrisphaera granulorum TaxID=317664 RepID=A0A315ZPP8_9ACTN|nr:PAS domain-containing protein [Quadrisphaera granulorum]PWJ47605.1 PAS domain S-box-containing protein [Quadrisphaera granulorum]SZE98735.1 PAS domain S-box-containing protein [Quadrisphaera granulorum]
MSSEPAHGPTTRQALWDLSAAAAGIGTYVLHLPGEQLEVDDRLLELSELSRATFSGRPADVYANVHPDDVDDVVARVQRAIASAGTYAAEYRIVLPGGGHRLVAARGRILTDEQGATTALVGAVYDVTESREATARTAAVLETMAVGYLALDADWSVTYVNAAAEHIAQASRADLVGRSFWEVFPATVGTEFERSYRHAVATGEPVSFDAYYPAPLDVWVEVRAVPAPDGLALYFLDITERVQSRAAAERAGARLAALGRIALSLNDAESLEELAVIMAEQGQAALDADGGAVAVPDPNDAEQLVSYISSSLGERTRAQYSRMPLDAHLPVTQAARTATRVLIHDLAEGVAFGPVPEEVSVTTGCQAWACLPLVARGRLLGVLSVGWKQPQQFEGEQLELLETYAAQCAQALQRLEARKAERAAAEQAQAAALAERASGQRQATLVAIAQALADADTRDGVLTVLSTWGASLLGANGCGLCLREADGAHVLTSVTDTYAEVGTRLQRVPADFPLPVIRAATTGAAF